MVGGSTTGEIHFGRHTDVPPPMRLVGAAASCMLCHTIFRAERLAALQASAHPSTHAPTS